MKDLPLHLWPLRRLHAHPLASTPLRVPLAVPALSLSQEGALLFLLSDPKLVHKDIMIWQESHHLCYTPLHRYSWGQIVSLTCQGCFQKSSYPSTPSAAALQPDKLPWNARLLLKCLECIACIGLSLVFSSPSDTEGSAGSSVESSSLSDAFQLTGLEGRHYLLLGEKANPVVNPSTRGQCRIVPPRAVFQCFGHLHLCWWRSFPCLPAPAGASLWGEFFLPWQCLGVHRGFFLSPNITGGIKKAQT